MVMSRVVRGEVGVTSLCMMVELVDEAADVPIANLDLPCVPRVGDRVRARLKGPPGALEGVVVAVAYEADDIGRPPAMPKSPAIKLIMRGLKNP